MKIDVLTIFPGMFEPVLGESIIKRARQKKKISLKIHDLRDYADDKRRTVDDRPFGSGPGMVMKIEPIYRAVKRILGARRGAGSRVILLTPQGRRLDQKTAREIAKLNRILLICGHYEGVDERVRMLVADDEISIGDYILTCGELPAMVLIDSVARLIPGVLGREDSPETESFENDLIEYPQYTRPRSFRGIEVPRVLLSGDHNKIAEWRKGQALERTRKRRPDMLRAKRKNAKSRI